MAGDLTDCAALARCLEQNATRVTFTLDTIFEKYNREFPDDDVIDIRHNKIVHNRGNVVSMPSSKVGFATHRKQVLPKEGSPFSSTLLEDEQRNASPGSEKSFISANCSRWAMDVVEESEPSDAETITDTSDSDSWEEEEEEDKSESVSQSESEDTDRGPDWYFSELYEERGPEERGKWLSIGNTRQELLKQQQRQRCHAERKRMHRHERTKTKHSSVLHRSAEKASCIPAQSSKPRHPVYFSAQRTGNDHHRNIKQQNSGWGSVGRFIHSSSSSQSPLKDRIGLPRRVAPVRLFQNQESPQSSTSQTNSVIVISSDGGEDLCGSNQQRSEEENSSCYGAEREYTTEQKSPSPLQDEVDYFLPAPQTDRIVHARSALSNSKTLSNTVVLRASQRAPDRGDDSLDKWIESCHPGQGDRHLLHKGGNGLKKSQRVPDRGDNNSADWIGSCHPGQGDRHLLKKGSNGLSDLAEPDCSKRTQGIGYKSVLDYQSPQISRHHFDKTFTVPPSGSYGKTVFQPGSSKDSNFQSGVPNSNIFQSKMSHPDIFHFRRNLPLRYFGPLDAVTKDKKQLSDRGDDTDLASCTQDLTDYHLQGPSVIARRKDVLLEKYSNKDLGDDNFSQIDETNLSSADSRLQQKTKTTFCHSRMQGFSSASSPSEEIAAKLAKPHRNCAQDNGLTSESFSESSIQGKEDMETSLFELQRKLDFLTNNMSPKDSAQNTPRKITDPKHRSGGTPNNGCYITNTDKLSTFGQQHLPKVDINVVPSGVKFDSNFSNKLALKVDVKRDPGSPQKSHPDASSKLALNVDIKKDSCSPLKANSNISSWLAPKVDVKVDSSSPLKFNPFANTSIGTISPLPLVKIESPQHWTEVKRKFHPVYESVSTEEIQHVLEMPNSDSMVDFLKRKYKTEPSSPPQEAVQKEFLNSPQPQLRSKLVSKSSVNFSKPSVSTPKVKQQYTIMPAFTETETEVSSLDVKKPKCPAVTHPSSDKTGSRAGSYSPSLRLDRHVPDPHTADSKLSVGVGGFHASPGEMIRQTISTPPQPVKELNSGTPLSDNSLVSTPIGPSVSSVGKHRASMLHLSSPSQPGLQNELNKTSDVGSSTPESKSQNLPKTCEYGCTCGQNCKSNLGPKSQNKLSGSAIQQIFTQLKQVSETKKTSRSVVRTKVVQLPHSHSATNLREIQQKKPSMDLFSEKANLSLSENERTRKCGAALPEKHQNDLWKWLSDLPCPSHSQKLLPSTERKINTPSSVLAQRDADKSKIQGNARLTTQSNRKGTHAVSSSLNFNFSKKLSQNTPKQLMRPVHTESAGTEGELTSNLRHSNSNLQDLKGLRNSSLLDPAVTSSTSQYRVEPKQYTASDLLSPNPKSRNQSLETSQSLTPSKLIAELNLGEVRSPLNLTQNCDAMSRLFLASPVAKGKKQSSGPAESFDTPGAGQRNTYRTPVCKRLTDSEKPKETLWTKRHTRSKDSICVQPTRNCASESTCDAEPKTQTSKLSVSHAVQVSRSKDIKCSSVKVSTSGQDTSVKKSGRAENSTCPALCPSLKNKDDCWEIFTSRNSKSHEHVEVRPSASGTTSFRASSPKLCVSDHAGSKPLNLKGSKMIHIHSPRRNLHQDHIFSSISDYPSFSPAKRGFQSDFHVFGELSSVGSPQKRRKITNIGATSTPTRYNKPSPIKFNMDETLSTIAGDSNDLNCTLQSAEDCSSPESGSNSEDQVTLISE